MSKNIQSLLMAAFEAQWEAFEAKHAKMSADIATDLRRMSATYGTEVVRMMLLKRGIKTDIVIAPDKISIPKTSRRRVKPKQQNKIPSIIRFTDLKPYVLAAVKTITGKPFTRKDIDKILDGQALVYEKSHVNLILSRYIIGVTMTGKTKADSGGSPLNQYIALEPLNIKPRATAVVATTT